MYKKESFYTGEAFYESACRMLPKDILEPSEINNWFIPYIVNTALACELFLKSLLSDSNTTPIYGHKWTLLFARLSEKQKEAILNHPYFKGSASFYDDLEEGGKYFRKMEILFRA